jgi:hypothetical protein
METSTNNSMQDFNFNEYKTNNKKVSWITRKLWWSAGADEYFLERSPKQDQVKYAGIGGIVLATGLLAAVSGGYAFFTIFKTKGDANDDAGMSWLLAIGIAFFMVVWGAIIFNLDRFIVSSTGKGDGTDSISWKEFGQAIPRILIAIILGFAISAPLEIRILESEINQELSKFQKEELIKLNIESDKLNKQNKADLEKDKAEYEKKLNIYEKQLTEFDVQIDKLIALRTVEIKDKRTYGIGKVANKMQEDINNKNLEKEKFIKQKATDVKSWRRQRDVSNDKINELSDKLRKSYQDNEKSVHQYDGLLKRIQISHEIGGIIPWVILLVFLCIEMGPIFFKMMMTKGPYDYMVENYNYTLQAENGLFKEDKMYEGRNGMIHMESFRYIDAELAIHNQEYKLQKQKEVDKNLIDLSSERKIKDIKENPDKYIG